MSELQPYRQEHLPGLAESWNRAFHGQPNFVRVSESDLLGRVIEQPSFTSDSLLVAARGDTVLGFVHFGPRTNIWHRLSERRADPSEGHIYAVIAPSSDRRLIHDLLAAGMEHLAQSGARTILLMPSWVYGTQPFYNGIAGAYEYPGLSLDRPDLHEVAAEAGFAPLAEYGTPELDFLDSGRLASLRAIAADPWQRVREWGMRLHICPIFSSFFRDRESVELMRGPEVVAMTAYGPWAEYTREYGRRLFGITGVYVTPRWRGKGLGKLIVIRAIEAAMQAGAEAVHLHIWKGNKVAWNLYHRALGFQPKQRWITLVKQVPRRSPSP